LPERLERKFLKWENERGLFPRCPKHRCCRIRVRRRRDGFDSCRRPFACRRSEFDRLSIGPTLVDTASQRSHARLTLAPPTPVGRQFITLGGPVPDISRPKLLNLEGVVGLHCDAIVPGRRHVPIDVRPARRSQRQDRGSRQGDRAACSRGRSIAQADDHSWPRPDLCHRNRRSSTAGRDLYAAPRRVRGSIRCWLANRACW
jgi:hypothetical protein